MGGRLAWCSSQCGPMCTHSGSCPIPADLAMVSFITRRSPIHCGERFGLGAGYWRCTLAYDLVDPYNEKLGESKETSPVLLIERTSFVPK